MPFPSVSGEPAARVSFTAEELRSLRCAAEGAQRRQARFPPELEQRFQEQLRREAALTRAVLALVPALLLGVMAFALSNGILALGAWVLACVAWTQTRWPAQALAEWLLVAALALLVPFLMAFLHTLPWGLGMIGQPWLVCVPVSVLVLAQLRPDRAMLTIAAYAASIAAADALSGGRYAWTPTAAVAELALLLLIVGGVWKLRHAIRCAWASVQLLKMQANHDFLSGLPNRRALELHYRRISRDSVAQRPRGILALVLLDLDHFRLINDHYGHEYGDRVVQRIGRELLQVPTQPVEFAARLAGKQFVLVLAADSCEALEHRLDEVLQRIEQLKVPNVRSSYGSVTASAGWALIDAGSRFSEPYLKAGDALRRAKRQGRNMIQGAQAVPSATATPLRAGPASMA